MPKIQKKNKIESVLKFSFTETLNQNVFFYSYLARGIW